MYKQEYMQRQREFDNELSRRNLTREVMKCEYNADDVWAASWAAYRLNGYEYVREINIEGSPGKVQNRVRVFELLNDQEQITDEDRNLGLALREYTTGLTMTALTRQLNSYEQLLAEAVLKEKIKGNPDISVIVSSCGAFHRELERRKKSKILTDLITGGHVGRVDVKTNLDAVQVISCDYKQAFNRYFNMGCYNGSLVVWWSDDVSHADTKVNLACRVKEHTVWECAGSTFPMTRLNYVRVHYK